MPIRVNGPDGAPHYFDDNATQEEIAQQMAAAYPQQHEQSPPPQHAPQRQGPPKHDMPNYQDDLRRFTEQANAEMMDQMPWYQKVLAGAGRSFDQSILMAKQLYANAADAIDPSGHRSDAVQKQVDAARNADGPLMNSAGGTVGNILGTMAQLYTPGATLKAAGAANAARIASRAFIPETLKGMALQGAVLGGLAPTATGESRVGNASVGAIGGIFGGGLVKAGGAALKLAGNMLAGAGSQGAIAKAAAQRLLSEASDIGNIQRFADSSVPGSARTLAEGTRDQGLARLEQFLRGQAGSDWGAFDTANNFARTNVLTGIAGTPIDMAKATAERASAALPLKAQAIKADNVDTSILLRQIDRLAAAQQGRPAVQKALTDIRELLTRTIPDNVRIKKAIDPLNQYLMSGRKSSADFAAAKAAIAAIRRGEMPNVQFTSQTGADALKAATDALGVTTAGENRAAVISKVRETIGDMLSGRYGGDSPSALAGSRELMAVRNQLDNVLNKYVPEHGQYLQAWREGSKPIDAMNIGQKLLHDATQSLQTDGAGMRMLSPRVANGISNIDAVAQSATGFRKAKAENILRPEQMDALRALQDDMERQVFARTQGTGSNSATSSRMGVDERINGAIARLAHGNNGVLGGMLRALDQNGKQQVMQHLSYLMQNPREAQQLLASMPSQSRIALQRAMVEMAQLGGVGAGVQAATSDQPMALDISGGVPGPAPTEAELEALRRQNQARLNAAAAAGIR